MYLAVVAVIFWIQVTDSPSARQRFVPFETTMSIQNPGDAWFWHPAHAFDAPAELFRRYLATVGRGSPRAVVPFGRRLVYFVWRITNGVC